MSIATEKTDMTVGEVKLQLQNMYLIPADHQSLFFSGVHLDNSRLLSAYGIGHNSTLEIMVNLDDRRSSPIWTSAGRKAKKIDEVTTGERSWVYSGEFNWKNIDHDEFSSRGKSTWSPDEKTAFDGASAGSIYEEEDAAWSCTPTSRPSNFSDSQYHTNVKSKVHSPTTAKLGADEFAKEMLKTEADIELLAEEVQRACDTVTELTAAKRELSLEIEALEKKLMKAYMTMKQVSAELAEAVETMAKETQRMRSAVRKPVIGLKADDDG